jgi:hypothetical protein
MAVDSPSERASCRPDLEDARREPLRYVSHARDVLVRDDEEVARRHRPDVHEGGDELVAVDEARRQPARDDAAEHALPHGTPQSFGWTSARQFWLGSMNHAAQE